MYLNIEFENIEKKLGTLSDYCEYWSGGSVSCLNQYSTEKYSEVIVGYGNGQGKADGTGEESNYFGFGYVAGNGEGEYPNVDAYPYRYGNQLGKNAKTKYNTMKKFPRNFLYSVGLKCI